MQRPFLRVRVSELRVVEVRLTCTVAGFVEIQMNRYNYADMCTCAFKQRPKLPKSKLDMGWCGIIEVAVSKSVAFVSSNLSPDRCCTVSTVNCCSGTC